MELEIDWTASKGRRVYGEAGRERHVALEPIPFDPDRPLRLAWDIPGTPACAIAQINAYKQVCLFPTISMPESYEEGVWEFGQMVADHLLQEYASPYGMALEDLLLVHIGDPAGKYRPVRSAARRQETRAAWDVLRVGSRMYMGEDEYGNPIYEERPGWGWHFVAGAVDHTTRQEAVRARLRGSVGAGLPALIIDPRAHVLINGFMGGYHYKEYEDGTYGREPEKNFYSHTLNAVEYLMTQLQAQPIRHRSDDDETEPEPYVSRASGRHRR
jgi:hypothetical protein